MTSNSEKLMSNIVERGEKKDERLETRPREERPAARLLASIVYRLSPYTLGVSFLASPSIVWPAPGGISDLACADFSSSDFIPSLKPFTALPRSLPRLRSFLVPKIRM